MPGFVAFGRRWAVGSDDMLLPAGVEGVARFMWSSCIAVLMYRYKQSFDCPGGFTLEVFCPGTIISNAVNGILCCLIIHKSLQGTLTDDWPRRGMKRLIYTKIAAHIPDIAWTALGTWWIYQNVNRCDPGIVRAVKWALLGSWGMIAFHWLVLFFCFDPVGDRKKSLEFIDLESGEGVVSTTAKLWRDRLSRLFSMLKLSDSLHQTFADVSQVLFEFIEEEVDIVPTDLAAGLIMLSERQRTQPLTPLIPRMHQARLAKEWMTPGQAAHYMRFAWASYGWPYYLLFHRLPAPFALLKLLRLSRLDVFGKYENIKQDNFTQLNTAAILDLTGIPREDLIFVSFHNKICELPFYICYDHTNRTVVVAIRGTLSLRDIMTDLIAVSDSLGEGELESEHHSKAHKGIIKAAMYICKCIKEKNIVDLAKAKEYRLVITGHSLGAGTAALVTYMLRSDFPDFDIVGFAFSPPLLASMHACKETEDYVCTVVVGDDIVGRLGIATMADLQIKLLTTIKNCNIPKHRVFNGWFERGIARMIGGSVTLNSTLRQMRAIQTHTNQHLRESQSARNFKESLDKVIRNIEKKKAQHDRLFLPGCIMHVIPQVHEGKITYSALWKQAEDFSQIIISADVIKHHCPDVVLSSLEWLRDRNQVPL